jgi:hypothetical protein
MCEEEEDEETRIWGYTPKGIGCRHIISCPANSPKGKKEKMNKVMLDGD